MTLPGQLRAIADRIEAAEAAHRAAVDELVMMTTDRVSLMDGWPVDEGRPGGTAAQSLKGTAAATGSTPARSTHAPGQARQDGATVADGRRAPAEEAAPTAIASDRKGTPAPATEQLAPAGESIGLSPAGPADAGAVRGSGRRPTRSEGVGSTPTPRSTITCPDCGKDFGVNGYGPHRRTHRPGRQPATADSVTAPAGDGPVMRKGLETYLCDQCSWTFLTREARDKHRAAHPQTPRGQPVGITARSALSSPGAPRVPSGGGAFDD
jgi:hypothetical protein